jgi:hypothetical protein
MKPMGTSGPYRTTTRRVGPPHRRDEPPLWLALVWLVCSVGSFTLQLSEVGGWDYTDPTMWAISRLNR